jgi:hypothetical protein
MVPRMTRCVNQGRHLAPDVASQWLELLQPHRADLLSPVAHANFR